MRINPVDVYYLGKGDFKADEADCLFSDNDELILLKNEELDYLLDKIHELESKIEELKYGN